MPQKYLCFFLLLLDVVQVPAHLAKILHVANRFSGIQKILNLIILIGYFGLIFGLGSTLAGLLQSLHCSLKQLGNMLFWTARTDNELGNFHSFQAESSIVYFKDIGSQLQNWLKQNFIDFEYCFFYSKLNAFHDVISSLRIRIRISIYKVFLENKADLATASQIFVV